MELQQRLEVARNLGISPGDLVDKECLLFLFAQWDVQVVEKRLVLEHLHLLLKLSSFLSDEAHLFPSRVGLVLIVDEDVQSGENFQHVRLLHH